MNEKEFIQEIEKLNIKHDKEKLMKLQTYYETLIYWNTKINITSITKKKDVYLKHFYDSLTIVKTIDLNKINNLLDVGSGGGFPGIVLKIFYPHLKIDILDANNKKILFLKKLIEKLDLKDVNLIHDRAENYALENYDKYDLVTARAVANLNILLELCLPFVKKGGFFISLKGEAKSELNNINNALLILKSEIEDIFEFNLPFEESCRTLIKVKKIGNNPLKYPRRYDKIKKKPL